MTMVELVLAVAITGIIVAFLGTAVYQIITVSRYGSDRLIARHELQNAAYWLNRDGQGATAASAGSGLLLTLSDNTSVTYALVGTELRRTAGSAQTVMARNISSAGFATGSRVITMSLTSSPQGRDNVSENGTYRVYRRPEAGG